MFLCQCWSIINIHSETGFKILSHFSLFWFEFKLDVWNIRSTVQDLYCTSSFETARTFCAGSAVRTSLIDSFTENERYLWRCRSLKQERWQWQSKAANCECWLISPFHLERSCDLMTARVELVGQNGTYSWGEINQGSRLSRLLCSLYKTSIYL